MGALGQLNVGIVGAAGRGAAFRDALEANGARVHAVCDVRQEALDACAERLGAREKYADYVAMLQGSELDAVVIGTPMQFHVPQSLMAVSEGIHVLCEVPAGVSVEECRQLVLACNESDAVYMMAENYTYMRPNVAVRELARAGLFGEVFYAEGEYLHELKGLNEVTKWRRTWQTGIDGITYGTHSLGPILQWMQHDRVAHVCCAGAGHHYRDPRGEFYHEESPVMLCKTAGGALIKIRVDMVSDRPHAMANYQLQGTEGVYESGRGGPVDRGKIWLRALTEKVRWFDMDSFMEMSPLAREHMPEDWLAPPEEARRAGHGGGDYFEVLDFMRAIRGEAACPIGIHEAMDMTLPGLISQRSIRQDGRWLTVPDSRQWRPGPAPAQLQMLWPLARLSSLPEPRAPEGYRLRTYRPSDQQQYLALMEKAGFEGWDAGRMESMRRSLLPNGLFVAEHRPSKRIVATANANHAPNALHPEGGELGWVAADPEHSGKGLGLALSAAVVKRFLSAGFKRIYLQTDDWRLPAVKTYLKLGFVPLLHREDMPARWRAVCEKLDWPFTPGEWPRG